MLSNMKIRKHQISAIEAFIEHYYYNENSKGILSMCCGSGKTYTFYNIMKKCIEKGEKLHMYVTSRILLVQGIIKDIIKWIYYDKLDIVIIVKVSNFSYINIKNELLNEIYERYRSKNIKEYKEMMRFLKTFEQNIKCEGDIITILNSDLFYRKKNVLIVTTYNSSSKIIDSFSNHNKYVSTIKNKNNDLYDDDYDDYDEIVMVRDNEKVDDNKKVDEDKLVYINPDLLVLDEAHNLASTEEINRAKKILADKDTNNFTPLKYLFMTATPLKIMKRNKTSNYVDDEIIFSMDNERLYGKVFYEYTFYDGIRDGYITDFDVVYLDDRDIMDKKINDNLQTIKDFDNNTKQHIYFTTVIELLIIIIKKYNLKNTIVYLENCEKVSLFENIIRRSSNYKHIKIYKVSSRESNKNNKITMNDFCTYNNDMAKILLTVDMLNEGVDIPVCDSILFMEERNSETTIVQNIGRALRINKNKEKAYVIIPTKIYNLEDSSYSSKYKKIREVCDILKEPAENVKVPYKRYAKGNGDNYKNKSDDPDIEKESGLVDKIEIIDVIDKKDEKNNMSNIDIQKINEYSDTIICNYSIKNRNKNFSNFTLDELKLYVQNKKVSNMYDLKKLIERKIIDVPHKHYKSGEWKCYGDLLFNKIYSYEESISVIKTIDITNVNSPREWQEFYNGLIEKEYNGDLTNRNIVEKIIYIPYDPKKYYLDEWENDKNEGWITFLSKKLENVIGLQVNANSSDTYNSTKNIQNIINNDYLKVAKLIPQKWTAFKYYKTDLSELKKYIDLEFDIDGKLEPIYLLGANYNVECKLICVKINNVNSKPPIVVGDDYKIKFDNDIFYKNRISIKKEIQRTKHKYINNGRLQNIINELSDEIDAYVKLHKKKYITH